MSIDSAQSWTKAAWWVRIYSIITIIAVIYGIAVAHVPFIIGTPWSSCETCGNKPFCVLAFHLYEVPLIAFHTFFAWYGLKRYSRASVHSYISLLSFSVVVSLVFFTFEAVLLMEGILRDEPLWETIGLTSVALILVSGAGLGMYVKHKLLSALYPPTTEVTNVSM